MQDKPRKINDPLFGLIYPNEDEWEIIESPLFQRLKEIKQLALTYYVYPTATHTRFSHSLGVFHITKKICKNLSKHNSDLFNRDSIMNLRMAALLHDIGHFPFSHALEYQRKKEDFDISKLPFFFQLKHEELGSYIIKNSYLKDNLIDKGYDYKLICNLIEGNDAPNIIHNKLINWELDADRLDYILRDSYFTGVAFGHINYEYLINNYKPHNNSRIVISTKSLRDIEHFITARFSLYDRVYIHKTISFFNFILSNVAYELITKEKFPSFRNETELNEILSNPDDSKNLYELTDYALIDHLRKFYNYNRFMNYSPMIVKKLETVLFREKHFQIENFQLYSTMSPTKLSLFKGDIKNEIKELIEEYRDEIFLDIPHNSFTKYIHPVIPSSNIVNDELKKARKEMEKSIWIQFKDEDPELFYQSRKSYFKEMSQFGITKILVYLNRSNEKLPHKFQTIKSRIQNRIDNI